MDYLYGACYVFEGLTEMETRNVEWKFLRKCSFCVPWKKQHTSLEQHEDE